MLESDLKDLKADRDRFVAFAFAAADVLIETSREGNVRFLSGATSQLRHMGRPTETPLLRALFDVDDAPVVQACIEGLVARGEWNPSMFAR